MLARLVLLLLHLDVAALFHLPATRPRSCARSYLSMCDGDWGFNMDELRDRISSSGNQAQLGPPAEVLQNLQAVYVLIFNQGNADEGVYTLQGRQSPASSYVLSFEQPDEAQRFAQLLQAEGFDLAQPMEWHADQVRSFCETGQFELGVVPTGALLTPPTHNEYDADAYERLANEMRMADGLDPEGFDARAQLRANEELDSVRRNLDRLFNQDGDVGI